MDWPKIRTVRGRGLDMVTVDEKEFQVFDSLSWTEAQKWDVRLYQPGMALRFHRKGGSAQVIAVEDGSLKV